MRDLLRIYPQQGVFFPPQTPIGGIFFSRRLSFCAPMCVRCAYDVLAHNALVRSAYVVRALCVRCAQCIRTQMPLEGHLLVGYAHADVSYVERISSSKQLRYFERIYVPHIQCSQGTRGTYVRYVVRIRTYIRTTPRLVLYEHGMV